MSDSESKLLLEFIQEEDNGTVSVSQTPDRFGVYMSDVDLFSKIVELRVDILRFSWAEGSNQCLQKRLWVAARILIPEINLGTRISAMYARKIVQLTSIPFSKVTIRSFITSTFVSSDGYIGWGDFASLAVRLFRQHFEMYKQFSQARSDMKEIELSSEDSLDQPKSDALEKVLTSFFNREFYPKIGKGRVDGRDAYDLLLLAPIQNCISFSEYIGLVSEIDFDQLFITTTAPLEVIRTNIPLVWESRRLASFSKPTSSSYETGSLNESRRKRPIRLNLRPVDKQNDLEDLAMAEQTRTFRKHSGQTHKITL